MYYIYLIQNKANKGLYYGYTIDLRCRLKEHNENGEWELIYYEAYRSEEDARKGTMGNQGHILNSVYPNRC